VEEDLNPRNVVLGHRLAVVRPNSGEAGGRVGWEWAQGGLEMSWARFEGSVGVEVLPVSPLSGAVAWRPRQLGSGDEGSTSWTTSSTRSTNES
jgi:hypothetical protein